MITSTPLSTMTTTSYKSSPGLDFNADIYVTNLMKAGNIADHEIGMDLNSLLHHWIHQGLDRPILASTVDSRKSFLSLIDTNVSRLLEIGPFFNPAFKCNDGSIKYADLLSTEQLIERAQAIGGATDSVPNIDYIYKDGGINTSGARFDAVFSSHVVEHQPSLVGHILNVLDLLENDGKYFFIVPDHRFCFDCYMTPSSLADVLAAHFERRVKPTLKSVFEHRLFTIDFTQLPHSNPFEKLVDHAVPGMQAALHEFNANSYVDVHCWYFTPKTLKISLDNCIAFGVLPSNLRVSVFPLKSEIGCIIEKQTSLSV
jgi:hypothetical protein